MRDDAIRLEILAELRRLRREPGPFDVRKMALAETITDIVGEGSPEQAHTATLALLETAGTEPDSDVRAFFETAGVNTDGDNLDQRLRTYAARHNVNERTGLRRSDRGAEQLSYLLRDGVEHTRPWASIAISQNGDVAYVSVAVFVPNRTQWRRPHVYINDIQQEGREFELRESTFSDDVLTGKERFENVPLRRTQDEDTPLLTVRVFWVMPVWASWQNGSHLMDERLYAWLQNGRQHSAEVELRWIDAAAAAAPHPLRTRPQTWTPDSSPDPQE